MIFRNTLLLTSCLFLVACDQMPDDWFGNKVPSSVAIAPLVDKQRWWQSFHDPLMDQLADQLLTQNLDIKIAQARVDEARGIERTAESGWFPDISATGNAARENNIIGTTKPISIAQGGFDASWELDVFGRTRSQVSAAENRVNANIASVKDIENSVLADVFKAVIQWRQAQETIKETNALLTSQEDQVKLLGSRARAGLIDASFYERAQAEYSQTATQLPLAQAEADAAEYQIERLLGKNSGELQSLFVAQESKPLDVPAVNEVIEIPIATIKNRPDVRAAKSQLLAAQADLAESEADLWPRLDVGSFFGAQATVGHVPVAGNPLWSVASSVTAPILNFGKLRGAVDATNARAVEASFVYENTTLSAMQEAKTALSDYLNGINAVARQDEALQHRRDAVNLANERFTRGLTDMTDLTTAQAELNQATLTLINRKADAATAYIRLQKALGMSELDASAH